jgi:hypothetical protein
MLESLERREAEKKLERRLLETLERRAAIGEGKPQPHKQRRKQVKPVQDAVFAKLRAKFLPRGKPPKKMSTSAVCRQIGIDPNKQWRSVNRALGREPKK